MPGQNRGHYDRFRNRIIFPISDVKGMVLGFGARVMDDSLPKYINSPETPVYIKGNHLYGLDHAKETVKQQDRVVVVEGYLDCIMPYQAGMRNIVASLGTALTPHQARLLKRYTHNVCLVYDGDMAGQMASIRSLDIFIDEGINLTVAVLPEGLDPDGFVRKHGISGFNKLVEGADSIFDYKINFLTRRFNPDDTKARRRYALKCCLLSEGSRTLFSSRNISGSSQARWIWTKRRCLMNWLRSGRERAMKISRTRPFTAKQLFILLNSCLLKC